MRLMWRWTYLSIIEADRVKDQEMKEEMQNEYTRCVIKVLIKVLKSKLNGLNAFRAINSWVVAVIRYRAGRK